MRKLILIILSVMLIFTTGTFTAQGVNLDVLIEELYGDIEKYDVEINRVNNIIEQIENKYCTRQDLVFGVDVGKDTYALYKESEKELTKMQKNKILSLEIVEKSKDFYEKLFESQEKSTLTIIDKWAEQNTVIEVKEVNFKYPILNPVISSHFGERVHPIFGTKDFHGGIDFADDKGTNIYASERGIVIFAQYNQSYGNAIVVMHGNGYFTLYGHIDYDGILVRVGDEVRQGQLIGKMGSTGMSTGSHLHFEIISGRNKVNPLPYLSY